MLQKQIPGPHLGATKSEFPCVKGNLNFPLETKVETVCEDCEGNSLQTLKTVYKGNSSNW